MLRPPKIREINKAAFDRLLANRATIEQQFEGGLTWERLDNRRASRIAVYREGAVTWDTSQWPALLLWAEDAVVRLHNVLAPVVSRVASELMRQHEP